MKIANTIIQDNDPILVTGAAGFIGVRVVESLLTQGFTNLRCLVRPPGDNPSLGTVIKRFRGTTRIEIIKGNLLSNEDCLAAARDAKVVFHLAAGTGATSFPDAFMNSVVTTRNLLEAILRCGCLKRLVSVSSFAVYSNCSKPQGRVLDESCPVEQHPERRGEAYCYAKVKQEELVVQYGKERGIKYAIVRPGVVYGPGKRQIPGRVGIGTFGIFLHLGGWNVLPLTYVENCAEAIVLAGIVPGIDGEVFNIVDDDLPSSRQVVSMYKRNVKSFKSIYVPRVISYLLFYAWEKYSRWSQEQLPPVFNRSAWRAYWKGSKYSNQKLKRCLGWSQRISTREGLKRYMESCRGAERYA